MSAVKEQAAIEFGIAFEHYVGSGVLRVVDLRNAHRRGRRCDVLRVRYDLQGCQEEHERAACHELAWFIQSQLNARMSYASVLHQIRRILRDHGLNDEPYEPQPRDHGPRGPVWYVLESIRGVDAPLPRLSISHDAWSLSADERGVLILDHSDRFNEPAEMNRGHNGKAYQAVKKHFAALKAAPSMSAAARILSDAGIPMHYWCRMD